VCYLGVVKLVVQVQLKPTSEQAASLQATMVRANEACDWLSGKAWDAQVFRQFALHKLVYREARAAFPNLSSQMVVRATAKVADAYKLDKKTRRRFRPLGSIAYDARILSWKGATANLWTLSGRQVIPFVCGDHQRALLGFERGEADLVLRGSKFYLFVTVDVPDTEEKKVLGWLGVDVGIVNIATTSDGQNFSGTSLNALRRRAVKLRQKLQAKGTKGAKRLLRKRRIKESRFSAHVNHCISKQIVATAERTLRGIALENLDGIRSRIRATRSQRRVLHSWAFGDLQAKISYKAARAGVAVCYVDPRNTSRECRVCGHIEKANRKTRDIFACLACGHTADADVNAARVIARRAEVIRPYGDIVEVVASHRDDLQSSAL
jgi:IS605 OrfB family transposase